MAGNAGEGRKGDDGQPGGQAAAAGREAVEAGNGAGDETGQRAAEEAGHTDQRTTQVEDDAARQMHRHDHGNDRGYAHDGAEQQMVLACRVELETHVQRLPAENRERDDCEIADQFLPYRHLG